MGDNANTRVIMPEITEHARVQQRLAVQDAVTRALSESTTFDAAATRILQIVCESLDWQVGGLWYVDRDVDVLRCSALWHHPGCEVPRFAAISRQRTFERDIGLPGRVWKSGMAAWIPDVVKDSNFPRAPVAASEGLHGALAFPIVLNNEVQGVIEFFSHEIRQPDHDLLEMMTAIGSQIGQFIERKRAEDALRTSEARKTAMLEASLDCIVSIDHEGRIIEFNAAAEKTFGYPRADVLGRELAQIIIPAQMREAHLLGLARCRAGEKGRILNQRLELSALRADGSEFPVELTVTQILSDGPPQFTAFLRDITERRRIEEALRKKTEQFSTLVEHIPDIVARLDRDLRFLYISPNVRAITGKPADEYIGKPRKNDGLDPEFAEARDQLSRLVFETGEEQRLEFPIDTPTGQRLLECRFIPEFAADGSVESLMTLTRDVTERKRAEAELRAKEAELELIAETTPHMLTRCSRDLRYRFVNEATAKLFGLKPEQIVGCKIADVMGARALATIMPYVERVLNGESVAFEMEIPYQPGGSRWVRANYTPERDAAGEVQGWIASIVDITDRIRAEEALRQSEQRFAGFMQHLPGLAWIKDLEGRYVYANDAAEIAFHAPREELYGKTDDEIFPAGTAARFKENDRQALTSRTGVQVIETLEHNDETVHYSVVNKFPILGPDGAPKLVGGMAVDITDRMRAEEALRDSEERYRSLTQAITSVVWTSDPRGRFVAPQPAWSDYTGQTWEELQGFGWVNALHPDDREKVRLLWNEACTSSSRYQSEGRLWHVASQAYRHFEARGVPILNPDGSVREWIGKYLDVEDRKRAEQILRLLWEAAALLLTADNPDAMLRELFGKIGPHFSLDMYFNYMVDESGQALQLESCLGISDQTAASISRLAFGQAICGTAALQRQPIIATHLQQSDDPKAQLVKSLGVRAYACYPLMSAGKLLGTLSFASRTRDKFGTDELASLATICHYVTLAYERLRLLNELTTANRQKDEFLAMLAHELRNPLAAIRYATELSRLPSVDPKVELIDVIERQVENLARLIDDLLDISRISRGKIQLHRQAGDLQTSVRRAAAAIRPLMEEKRHTLSLDLAEGPLPIFADLTRIEQIIGNLLTNAAKYTPEGGRIGVQVRSDGDEAVLRVQDSGIGISPDILPHVFDLFTQADRSLDRSQGGLGIGLTVVQKLVELHGGTVAVYSEGVGKGAEFIVRLPLSRVPDSMNADAPRQENGPRSGLRIVIVEDNRDTARTSAMLLESQGHQVCVAHAGNDGVELALRERPHAMLVDIGLPGLNGFEVATILRAKGLTQTRLIAVSGYGQADDRERSRMAGFDHHLIKPVDNEQLFGLLNEIDAGIIENESLFP